MTLGKKQIEARVSLLSGTEELSDMWSDSANSDSSKYAHDAIRIDMDNHMVTSLHGALKHNETKDQPLKFKHSKLERGNLN